ncbi:MAG: ATP-binding protein [Bacteroidales bacterium]|nr:ATP-binding protein [Bacteroidales bacterium]
MDKLIGRQEETKILDKYFKSKKAEFVAIYGRRRVGKTFLIKKHFAGKFDFYMSGTIDAPKSVQFNNFREGLVNAGMTEAKTPENWQDAFFMLRQLLEKKIRRGRRCIVFIDEIPCLDTPKSGFVGALDHFWNTWAVDQNSIMLIVCGSSTSWIINNIIDNHGGLHNRITHEMYLRQFTLGETEKYLEEYGFDYDRFSICQLYMAIGGVPYYLSLLDNTKSVAQNIDSLFFGQSAQLQNEFGRLFKSLFKNAEPYLQVIETLALAPGGLTREEIAAKTKIPSGARLTLILSDLENCDFISHSRTRGKKIRDNQHIYQVCDMFTMFYSKFCRRETSDENYWTNISKTTAVASWQGLAFERVCFLHINQIKNALGIAKIHTEHYSWRSTFTEPKSQIDLAIERADRMANICEIKFCDAPYTITKDEDMKLRVRLSNFKTETGANIGLLLTFIAPYGISGGKYSGQVKDVVTMEELFI